MAKKILIVGGVAGGATAAARLRRLDETAEIIIFERGKYVSYANCGLPYFIGGTIAEKSALLLQTPETLKARYNLDVRVENEVIAIDRSNRTVKVRNLATGEEYSENYDKLVLATGAEAIKPPIEGINEASNLFIVRSVEDSEKIKEFIGKEKLSQAMIIGAGFIGLEMAENIQRQGLNVTIIEKLDQVMSPLDKEMAALVSQHLLENKINVILNNGVASIHNQGKKVILENGTELVADLIILAIGVKPENKLAKEVGLEIAERGGLIVSDNMVTSDPDIYALGDVIQVKDRISNTATQIPLAWPANRQARIVADHICGINHSYKGTLGAAICKVFDLTVATTGNNEKQLQKRSAPYQAIHIHPGSHAGYYPGSTNISLKLLFNPETGEIYGAQGVGRNGVDKRLDVISTAIQAGIKAWELQDLELAYAPPYSSAKDPINMLGYIAEDLRDGLVKIIQWNEISNLNPEQVTFLDIREPEELILGQIPNSLNIPLNQLRNRVGELSKDKPIYVYCQVGLRGYIAARMLSQIGYQVYNLDGGLKTWSAATTSTKDSPLNIADSGVVESLLTNPTKSISENNPMQTIKLDACGLQCPGPLLKVAQAIKDIQTGEIIEATATDPAFPIDMKSWCDKTGNTFISEQKTDNGTYSVLVQKGTTVSTSELIPNTPKSLETAEGLTIILFSGDLDKALAAFIIANGAIAFGKKVTIFCTFWGLNVLRKASQVKVKKNFLEKMFGMMMPRGADKLGISKMNMAGLGAPMIKFMMKQKNVDSLPTLMESALKNGAKLVACTMSMDIMGIKREELIEGAEIGGVATYLGKAEEANVNLFI